MRNFFGKKTHEKFKGKMINVPTQNDGTCGIFPEKKKTSKKMQFKKTTKTI
jgi:hypothetical protein